jgi:hypothetical protein
MNITIAQGTRRFVIGQLFTDFSIKLVIQRQNGASFSQLIGVGVPYRTRKHAFNAVGVTIRFKENNMITLFVTHSSFLSR